MLPQQLIHENAELAALGRQPRHFECPQGIIALFQERFPNHLPILGADGDLSQIWDIRSDARERGGITDTIFDAWEDIISTP